MNTEYSQTSLASDEIGDDVKQQIAEKKKLRRKYRWISIALVIVILISVVGLIGSIWTGWISFSGEQYYFVKGSKAIGITTIDNNQYFFDDSGAMQTGWQTIDGSTYYFSDDGIMQTGWLDVSENKYYLNSSGVMQTGWQSLNGEKYYFDSMGTMQTGWQTVDGSTYYLDNGGAMQTGFQMIGAKKYYFDDDGKLTTGWLTLNGRTYYRSPSNDGALAIGRWTIGDDHYYFETDGVMATGTVETSPGLVYHMDEKGRFQYVDTTLHSVNATWVDERISFTNRSGGNTSSDYRKLDKPIENALSLSIKINVTESSYGSGDGQWQVHVRTLDGKWKRVGFLNVKDSVGELEVKFDSPVSFDAYVCTRYEGTKWSGRFSQKITEVTYRAYDFGPGGKSD